MMWWQQHGSQLLSTIVFTVVGMLAFGAFFLVLPRVLPFSLKKEIEEDHNTALAIIVGSIVIGMALIIAAAVGGG